MNAKMVQIIVMVMHIVSIMMVLIVVRVNMDMLVMEQLAQVNYVYIQN